jgi:hypothetical protein
MEKKSHFLYFNNIRSVADQEHCLAGVASMTKGANSITAVF